MDNLINIFLGLEFKVQSAIIAASTSLIIFTIGTLLRNFLDTRLHSKKLQKDYIYEERKKVKNVIASHKGHLLKAANSLNGRLKNLTKTEGQRWLKLDGNYTVENGYYFKSFIYRILSFFARIKLLEDELIHLDTVSSTKNDIEFLKFLRIFPLAFHDGDLVEGIKNKDNSPLSEKQISNDLIYRDVFNSMFLWMIKDDKSVISFEDFLESYENNTKKFKELCEFLDGINPTEERYRWDRLYILQVLLICFLNKFGYDFHETDYYYFKKLMDRQGKKETFSNIEKHLFKKYKVKSFGFRKIRFALSQYKHL